MTEHEQADQDASDDAREPEAGSVAEEAVKLIAALRDWAGSGSDDGPGAASNDSEGAEDDSERFGAHLGHGPDCRYCPVCRGINLVRETSPEVRQHLSTAATSMLQAALTMLQAEPRHPDAPAEPVQKIRLDPDSEG